MEFQGIKQMDRKLSAMSPALIGSKTDARNQTSGLEINPIIHEEFESSVPSVDQASIIPDFNATKGEIWGSNDTTQSFLPNITSKLQKTSDSFNPGVGQVNVYNFENNVDDSKLIMVKTMELVSPKALMQKHIQKQNQ